MEFTKEKNAESTQEITLVGEGFIVLKFSNESNDSQKVIRDIDSKYIQFHFCLKGNLAFHFNDGRYSLAVHDDGSLLLYNPQRELPLNVEMEKKSWMITVLISIQKFHLLFSKDANYITFLSEENKDKKYYKDGRINPSMAVVLNQLYNYNMHASMKELYFKGKCYELLSLYFNRSEDADIEQCPFLVDEDNVAKIKRAKDIIVARMTEPPTLQELSNEINLSLKKLKAGFKQIYGDTVYGFLLHHKMDYARKLLESQDYNVNEVGLKVGYSTSSHFIAAFKKRFGTTPKKYIQSLN
jgi:AraC-like DNA-binding protein